MSRSVSVIVWSAILTFAAFVPQATAVLQSKAQFQCIRGLNSAGAKVGNAAGRHYVDCLKQGSKGRFRKGGSARVCAHTDSKGRVAKAKELTVAVQTDRCSTAPDFGPTEAATVNDGFALHLFDLDRVFGLDLDLATIDAASDKKGAKCQTSVARELAKAVKAKVKWFNKCKTRGLKSGEISDTSGLEACLDFSSADKVRDALTKAQEHADDKCVDTAVAVAFPGECSGADLGSLIACIDPILDCGVCLALEVADNLAIDCDLFDNGAADRSCGACPRSTTFTISAGTRMDSGSQVLETSATSVVLGWTGFAHVNDVPDGTPLTLGLDCGADYAPTCGECAITGIVYDDTDNYPARCVDDTSAICTSPFTAGDACGGALCAPHFAAPRPTVVGGLAACTVTHLATDVSGTVDIESGAAGLALDFVDRIHLGFGEVDPCPTCSDESPNDGIKGGICSGGLHDGAPCDTHGVDGTWGATSFDCPPGNLIPGDMLRSVSLTTGSVSLPFGAQCTSPDSICACALCSGDTSITCSSDADCSAVGAGTCSEKGTGVDMQPNACDNLECADIGSGKGECMSGPVDRFCDDPVRLDGSGVHGCNVNSDCTTWGVGTCTLDQMRRCFPDPIVATGTADTVYPVLVDAFCVAPVTSEQINGAVGLPGPSRVTLEMSREDHR